MDLQKSVKQAWEILTLKQPVMQAVAKDPGALQPALIILAAVSVLVALSTLVFPSTVGMVTYRAGILDVVIEVVISIVLGVAILYTTGYLAEHVFHSKLDMNGYVRVMGHATLINLLGFFPPLTPIGGIWSLIVLCVLLNKIGKMGAGSIILLLLLEGLIIMVIAVPVMIVALGAGIGGGMMY